MDSEFKEQKTRVVHCKREDYDVLIDRRTQWGNPFFIGRDGDRETVVKKYREWILTRPDLLAKIHELKGKRLGCWCAPKNVMEMF